METNYFFNILNKFLNLLCLLLLILIFNFCHSEQKTNEYSLIPTQKKLSLKIPYDTKNTTKCLQYYLSENSIQYLCYLNRNKNKLLFFYIDSMKLAFDVQMPREGPHGVGNIKSFYIYNLDTIILTTAQMNKLFIIDQYGNLKNRITVKKIMNGKSNTYFAHSTNYSKQLILNNNKIYAGTSIPHYPLPGEMKNYKICMEIDLINENQSLLPLCYPALSDRNNKPVHNSYSKLYFNNKFVYSFFTSHQIYITKDHISSKVIPAKSKYIKKDFKLYDPIAPPIQMAKTVLEHPTYRNFMYDKYRNVFYRFVYPGVEVKSTDDIMDLLEFRPVFSIMILDSNLNIVGEQLMAYNTYNMEMAFVGKEGLYISTNHYKNTEFDEDYSKFEIFKLMKK